MTRGTPSSARDDAPSRPVRIDVVAGGLRVLVESPLSGLPYPALAGIFGDHGAPARPGPHGRLRVVPAQTHATAAAMPPRVAQALGHVQQRLRSSRAQADLHRHLTSMLAHEAAARLAEELVATAAEPVVAAWSGSALVGDAASRQALLLLDPTSLESSAWRALVNGAGILLGLAALERGGLLLHGAGLEWRGRGYAFVGTSGSGKSTLCRRYRRGALSDDGVLALRRRGGWVVTSTPLRQVPGPRARRRGREPSLRALLFLRQARRDQAAPLTGAAALAELLARHVHFLPHLPPTWARRALENGARLVGDCPSYRLRFTRRVDLGRLLDHLWGRRAPE